VGVRGPNPTAFSAGSSTLPYQHEILKNPMGRKADQGAVIPSAGGEKGLGQGWVCGGQMGSGVAPDGRDGARPYRVIWFIGFERKRIGPGVGVRGPNGFRCGAGWPRRSAALQGDLVHRF